jgi:hypothetical protein
LALGYTGDKVEPAVKMEVWAFPLQEVTLRIQGARTWVGGAFGARVMKAAENP